jgi:hypothetical protein
LARTTFRNVLARDEDVDDVVDNACIDLQQRRKPIVPTAARRRVGIPYYYMMERNPTMWRSHLGLGGAWRERCEGLPQKKEETPDDEE